MLGCTMNPAFGRYQKETFFIVRLEYTHLRLILDLTGVQPAKISVHNGEKYVAAPLNKHTARSHTA